MATKESKRQFRELVEALEQRIHRGPAVQAAEIHSARDFLRRNDFSPASDYFNRLTHIESRLHTRFAPVPQPQAKRNYGGLAGGCRMQVQSVYDHVIISTCYAGEFNTRRGRIKISHRFNQEGRLDFVELKYLKSLDPLLNGELRKLLLVKSYSFVRKDWHEAAAFVLETLPRELVFLYADIFRCPRSQLFGWLMNFGHQIVKDLLKDLQTRKFMLSVAASGPGPNFGWPPGDWNRNHLAAVPTNGDGRTTCAVAVQNGFAGASSQPTRHQDQLPVEMLAQDDVAMPILKKASRLEAVVEEAGDTEAVVRYVRKDMN